MQDLTTWLRARAGSLSQLDGVEITAAGVVAVLLALWLLLPFAVYGLKRRLDDIATLQRQQTDTLLRELRRTNELLTRRLVVQPAVDDGPAAGRFDAPARPPAAEDRPAGLVN